MDDIQIYRPSYNGQVYDCAINVFHKREGVKRDEVMRKVKTVFGQDYHYAEPSRPGRYAFGGCLLFSSDSSYPEFNTPVKLHDRDMDLER